MPAAGERMIMISFAIGDYVTVRLFDLDYPGRDTTQTEARGLMAEDIAAALREPSDG